MAAADYATPQRVRRTLAEPQRRVEMTPTQARAQESTVAILRRYADAAESHLRARAARLKDAGGERLCPCGINVSSCLCAIQRSKP